MLQIHSSNRLEILAGALADRLRQYPSPPFVADTIITASPAHERWLRLQLCRRNGIVCNTEHPLPAAWVWRLASELLDEVPTEDPLGREALAWRIFEQLPLLLDQRGFAQPAGYLRGDADGLKRWQLARRIADLFDRYQYYRPDLIRRWEQGSDTHWQAQLWRTVRKGVDVHRVAVIERLLARLADPLPETVLSNDLHLFGLGTLPPLLVEVFAALSEQRELHLWLLSPTPHYWADLYSRRAQAAARLKDPQGARLLDVGNQLLAAWGEQGQVFQDLLLEAANLEQTQDHFQEPVRGTLLDQLQADIYELQGDGSPAAPQRSVAVDASIEVHSCHSPLRECQVLRDRLLAVIEADGVRPEEILVMVPEIGRYAPYIEAVFAGDGEWPHLPWNLSDVTLPDEHPLVQGFLALLELPSSRFGRSEVLAFLDLPEVLARFGLTADEVTQIHRWLEEAQVHWGRDGSFKLRFGLPPNIENTWQQALERLFAGYALGEEALMGDIASLPLVSGMQGRTLGAFCQLLERLENWAQRLANENGSAVHWVQTLHCLLDDFFFDRDGEHLPHLREVTAALADEAAHCNVPLSLAVIRNWLVQALGNISRRGRFYSGGITFCGMQPLRGVPFPVVCLMGMQEEAFPRRDRQLQFDLMAQQRRRGDPRPGDEDRYLMLEALLAARQRLIISYTGQDIRTNEPREPSLMVRELLDYLDRHYRAESDQPLSRWLLVKHPLQPFSHRYFSGSGGLRGYDHWWCETARAIRKKTQALASPDSWPDLRFPELDEEARELTLPALLRFFTAPCAALLASRMGLRPEGGELPTDEEPFALDGLSAWQLKQAWVERWLDHRDLGEKELRAKGLLPHGGPGSAQWRQIHEEMAGWLESHQQLRKTRWRRPHLDLLLEDSEGRQWRISGRLESLADEGLLAVVPSRLKGRQLLCLWLEHLLWIALEPGEAERSSRLLALDAEFELNTAFGADAARQQLATLLSLMWRGLHEPLPLFPETSYAWARTLRVDEKGEEAALRAAHGAWDGNPYMGIPGEADDSAVQLLRRGLGGDPLQSSRFQELALTVYGPLLDHGALR